MIVYGDRTGVMLWDEEQRLTIIGFGLPKPQDGVCEIVVRILGGVRLPMTAKDLKTFGEEVCRFADGMMALPSAENLKSEISEKGGQDEAPH